MGSEEEAPEEATEATEEATEATDTLDITVVAVVSLSEVVASSFSCAYSYASTLVDASISTTSNIIHLRRIIVKPLLRLLSTIQSNNHSCKVNHQCTHQACNSQACIHQACNNQACRCNSQACRCNSQVSTSNSQYKDSVDHLRAKPNTVSLLNDKNEKY